MKEKKLLRRAAYWLDDFARGIRNAYVTGDGRWSTESSKREYDKLRKLAADCRKAGRA